MINQQLSKNKQDDSKLKFQNHQKGVKGKVRLIEFTDQFMEMGLPKKKKMEDISGAVYLTLIADQRQTTHHEVGRKEETKDNLTQQIHSQSISQIKQKLPQKYMKPLTNPPKPIEVQVKMQEQQQNTLQYVDEQSQTQNEYSSLNDQIINQCLIWKCPCGADMFGPLEYFNHIQVDHKNQPLETILYKKTLQKMFDNYPNFTATDLQIIEQAQDTQFQKQINKIFLRHQHFFKSNLVQDFGPLRNQGSYSDMACTFIQNLSLEGNEKKMIIHFFNYLKLYIDETLGKKHWNQEPPNELLKYGNQIITFFSGHKLQFKPFRGQDIRQLFYTLSGWMFMNRWTNHRIFYQIDQDNLKQEEQVDCEQDQQKMEEG